MEGSSEPGAIPRLTEERHRAPWNWRVHQALGGGGVRLRGLRRPAVHVSHQVQLKLRLAGLLRRPPRGHQAHLGRGRSSRGDHVRAVRRPPGPRVQGGGLPHAHRRAPLRQQHLPQVQPSSNLSELKGFGRSNPRRQDVAW